MEAKRNALFDKTIMGLVFLETKRNFAQLF